MLLRSPQTKKKTQWPVKVLGAVVVGGLALLVAAAVFVYGSYQQIVVKKTPADSTTQSAQVPLPSPTPLDPLRPRTFLLMGYGGGGHAGGLLTDTMMAAVVQPRTEQIFLISLPRDIWIELPVPYRDKATSWWKINSAYAIGSDDRRYINKPAEFTGEAGGGELAKYAVAQVLGFPIEHFVTINFNSFVKAIDVLGGVDVQITQTFEDPWYPTEGKEEDTCGKTPEELAAVATLSATLAEQAFRCRYELLYFDVGTHHLDGQTALKYVRSRHSQVGGGDLGRAARQRAVLAAAREKILALSFVPKLIPFVKTLRGDVQTDIDFSELEEIINGHPEWREYEIEGFALSDKDVLITSRSADGQFILVTRDQEGGWKGVHEWVKARLEGRPATPSAGT